MIEMLLKALGITPEDLEQFKAAFTDFVKNAKEMREEVTEIKRRLDIINDAQMDIADDLAELRAVFGVDAIKELSPFKPLLENKPCPENGTPI